MRMHEYYERSYLYEKNDYHSLVRNDFLSVIIIMQYV